MTYHIRLSLPSGKSQVNIIRAGTCHHTPVCSCSVGVQLPVWQMTAYTAELHTLPMRYASAILAFTVPMQVHP